MAAKFVTVQNDNLGGRRARVPESRVRHLIDDWRVVPDDEPAPVKPRRRKPTKKAAAAPAPVAAAPELDPPTDPADPAGEGTDNPSDDGVAVAEQE
jgi:hypothetical protein